MSLENVICPRCGKYYGVDWATEQSNVVLIHCGGCNKDFMIRRGQNG